MSSFLKQQEVKREQRRRQKIIKTARAIQKISIVVLVWLIGIATLYAVYLVIFVRPYFEIRQIEVTGDMNRLTSDEIIKLALVPEHSNLFATHISAIKQNILKNRWVKDLAIQRVLPDKLNIFVTEYRPAAILMLDKPYFVDQNGVVFKEVESADTKDYPVFTGFEILTKKAQNTTNMDQLKLFLELKRLFEKGAAADLLGISEINFDPRVGYSIITFQPSLVIRVGFNDFESKFSKLETVLPAIQRQADSIRYVDINLERKVIVKYGT